MRMRLSRSMYLDWKREQKMRAKAELENAAATCIQRAVLAWLYAPPDASNAFRGGAMYRRFIRERFGEFPDSWEEHFDTLRPAQICSYNYSI